MVQLEYRKDVEISGLKGLFVRHLKIIVGLLFMVGVVTMFDDYAFNGKIHILGFDNQPTSTEPRPVPVLDVALAVVAMLIATQQ